MIYYVEVNDRIRRCVHDTTVVRGKMVDSDHHLVAEKMKMAVGWKDKRDHVRW